MNVVGVIPARMGSTRFPGKPLALIAGRPLLAWVIDGVRTASRLSDVIVATDDDRIAEVARHAGVRAVMTDSDLATGTDRVWQAIQRSAPERARPDVVVNIQGDEPLTTGSLIDALVTPFFASSPDGESLAQGNNREVSGIDMATLGRALDHESLHSVTTAKIVLNHRNEALYFSRFPIPYSRQTSESLSSAQLTAALKHIGIYAYRTEFLERFCATAPTALELAEGLEQLRALAIGARIKVVQVEHDSWGVDTPEDVQKIEMMMRQRADSPNKGRIV